MLPLSQAKLKLFSALHLKKARQAEGLYLAPGHKLLQEVLQRGLRPVAVVCAEAFAATLPALPPGAECYVASEAALRRISGQEQPEGVVTVLPLPAPPVPDPTRAALFLHGIQDPGNLGTLLRTAAWFGMPQVVCSADCADAHGPKAVRASMGAVLHLPVCTVPHMATLLAQWPAPVRAADLAGPSYTGWQPGPTDALLMGSEAHGIPPALLALPTVQPLHIPGSGLQESLNVAVAAGILLAKWAGGQ
jgi:TrmH family RNA methyltransferase